MSELFFVVKLFLLTVAIVLVMQIQVGDRSLESHAMNWVQSSTLVEPMNAAARGGAKLVRDLTRSIEARVNKNTGKHGKEEKKSSSSFRWTTGESN